MNCPQCGTALQPNSGFCGACGYRLVPPQQPQQQGFPQQQQQGFPQQQQQGFPQQQQQGFPPPQQQGQPPGSIRPFPQILQQGMNRLTGHIFLAPTRLYFICSSTKGGLMAAIGKGIGGAGLGIVGGVVGAVVEGSAAQAFGPRGEADEATLYRAAQENKGSLIMEPPQIKQIKDTFWTHAIWFNGLTYALPGGFSSKELKREVGLWCQANNVKHAGLLPTT